MDFTECSETTQEEHNWAWVMSWFMCRLLKEVLIYVLFKVSVIILSGDSDCELVGLG